MSVYLDHNATTPVHAEVRDAMLPWLGERWGNPSSAHAYGRAAAEAIATGRAAVAALVGAQPEQVVFCSGGTEADNLALLGPTLARPRVITTAVEHPAIDEPMSVLEARGCMRVKIPVLRSGVVDLEAARSILAEPAGMVSAILAQNETGVIQPVAALAALARASAGDVLVHTDAAQAVGKIAVDVRALDVDLLTIVGHKLYAPCGIGALIVRRGLPLQPLTRGGGQERGLRPGTEPVALIVALGAACAVAARDVTTEGARQASLRDALWAHLREHVPGIIRTGDGEPTLPNTLHVRFPGVAGRDVLAHASEVAASTGSACHSDHDMASGVLGAMGLSSADAMGAVRLSLGRSTTRADIDRAAASLVRAYGLIRR
jgi:cysteine desulfurase